MLVEMDDNRGSFIFILQHALKEKNEASIFYKTHTCMHAYMHYIYIYDVQGS